MDGQQPLTAQQCAEMIKKSHSLAVLSGAGISTAAGIPDFRGPQGLYVTRRYDPEKVFEISWFDRKPEYFYEFSSDFVNAAAQSSRPSPISFWSLWKIPAPLPACHPEY